MNVRRLTLWTVAVAGILLGTAAPAGATADRPGLSATSARASYPVGTTVDLTFTVTNGTPGTCQLSAASSGTYVIEAVTRDGKPVAPRFGETTYGSGLENEIRQGLRSVPPGGSVSIRPTDFDGSMSSDAPSVGGTADTTLWPITAPGRYAVTVVYAAPVLDGDATPQCAGDSAPATVSFTVTAAAASGSASHTVRTALLIAAGLVLVALILLLWWWLRRRQRHVTAAVTVLLLIAGVALAGTGIGQHAAFAEIRKVDAHGKRNGDKTFDGRVDKCIAEFDSGGLYGDPSSIMPELERNGPPIVTIEPQNPGAGSQTVHTDASPQGVTSSIVAWNSTADEGQNDGGDLSPCAELYHELVHAYQNYKGTDSRDFCADTGVLMDDVEAAAEENQFRANHNLGRRVRYGTLPLPNPKDCTFRKPGVQEQADQTQHKCGAPIPNHSIPPPNHSDLTYGRDAVALATPVQLADAGASSACGMNNGDPHVLTFDGHKYDFQAVGEFIDTRSAADDLEVQTRQVPLPPTSRYASIDSAIAMRIGTDKAGFYDDQGVIDVHVNGSPVTAIAGTLTLPGGGTITRRTAEMPFGGDAYTVVWPDGSTAWIDPVRPWGLRLYVQLAADRAGHVTGLLGNFDGNAGNDLVTSAGAPIPLAPTYTQLYRTFADSWRVSPSGSLFDYDPGQSTTTFTDRTFPDQLHAGTVPSTAATDACTAAGVVDAALLQDCAFDVDASGSLAFAVNEAGVQEILHPTVVGTVATGVPSHTGTVTVAASNGSTSFAFPGTAGEHVFVSIAASASLPEGCYATLSAPDGSALGVGCLQAGVATIDRTTLPSAGTYHVVIKPPAGAAGSADIQVFSAVDQTVPITIGGTANATIAQPGAVSTATFSATAGQKVFVDVTTTFAGTCGALALYAPDGTSLETGCVIANDGDLDGVVLPATGAYRIVVDPTVAEIGTARIHLIADTDQSESTTIGGGPVTMSVNQPGAVSTVTFPATPGTNLSATITTPQLAGCGLVTLYAPDGTKLASTCLISGSGAFNPTKLPTTGTYRVVLDPYATDTGSVVVTLTG